MVGADGAVATTLGVAVDGADSGPAPSAFTAASVKVYVVPLVRPVTRKVVADGEMPGIVRTVVPVRTVTVRLVIPVVPAGRLNASPTVPLPGVAAVIVGTAV